MPIADEATANVVRMTVQVSDTTDNIVSFDVPPPIPVGMSISEGEVRQFYQRMVNALEASPDFRDVSAALVTEQRAAITPDVP